MAGEGRESQEPWAGEKVYPNPGEKLATHIPILAGCIIVAIAGVLLRIYPVQIAEWLYDIPLRSAVNTIGNLGLGVAIFCAVYFVGYLIWTLGGFPVKEIALSKEGVVLRRGRKPIIIQKITNMEEMGSGRTVKLTGLTPEGKTVNRRLMWSDVGRKRWQEFKQDLREFESRNNT